MWRLCRFRCSCGTSAIIASVIRSACQSNRRSSSSSASSSTAAKGSRSCGGRAFVWLAYFWFTTFVQHQQQCIAEKEGDDSPMQTAKRKARETRHRGGTWTGSGFWVLGTGYWLLVLLLLVLFRGQVSFVRTFQRFSFPAFPSYHQLPATTRQRKSQKRY